jgi:stearoyl-CoA desaturase (delta-9 desaturase)
VATTLQSSFLQIQEVHDQLIFFLRETASSSQLENILGALFLASYDADRSVAAIASKVWEKIIFTTPENADGTSSSAKHISLDEVTRSSLTSFIQRAALDPNGVYTSFNPVTPTAPPLTIHSYLSKNRSQAHTPNRDDGGDQTPRSKIVELEESEQDRTARLRSGALGALRWLLGKLPCSSHYIANILLSDSTPSLSEGLRDIFSNLAFWTALSPHEIPVWVNFEGFGFKQPNVRKSAWTLFQSLLAIHQGNFIIISD